MKSSVALCTYNGEKFLRQQLESLAGQSQLPGELVVCDDVSTDGTSRIIAEFAARAPFPVHVYANEQNLGSNANFAKAVSRCEGDVIFLCDQDDYWVPEKVETMLEQLASHKSAGFAFSNATVVDDFGNPRGYRLWKSVGMPAPDPNHAACVDMFELLCRQYAVTGATMAFRREFVPLVLPVSKYWVHDGWIAFLISAFANAVAIDVDLIHYRQHSSQQIGATKPLMLWPFSKVLGDRACTMIGQLQHSVRNQGFLGTVRYAREIRESSFQQYVDAQERIHGEFAAAKSAVSDSQCRIDGTSRLCNGHVAYKLDALKARIRYLQVRTKINESLTTRGRWVLSELRSGGYHRYGFGYLSAVRDIFGI